jgi:hypothetical protein
MRHAEVLIPETARPEVDSLLIDGRKASKVYGKGCGSKDGAEKSGSKDGPDKIMIKAEVQMVGPSAAEDLARAREYFGL